LVIISAQGYFPLPSAGQTDEPDLATHRALSAVYRLAGLVVIPPGQPADKRQIKPGEWPDQVHQSARLTVKENILKAALLISPKSSRYRGWQALFIATAISAAACILAGDK
jgi:hypothetical protein